MLVPGLLIILDQASPSPSDAIVLVPTPQVSDVQPKDGDMIAQKQNLEPTLVLTPTVSHLEKETQGEWLTVT